VIPKVKFGATVLTINLFRILINMNQQYVRSQSIAKEITSSLAVKIKG